jgi:glycosyltransferase involved in cell wall biosynthesis
LKILYLIYDDVNNPWCGGGGSVRAIEFAKNLPHLDKIIIVTGNYPSAKDYEEGNLKVIRSGSDKSNLISRLTFAFSAKRYINIENPDIIIVSFSELTPILFFKKMKTPRVAIMHHILGKHSFKKFKILGFIPHLTQYLGVRSYDNIVVVSRELEERLKNRFPHKRVTFIPNGIDTKLFMAKPESSENILFLGRLDIYMKGLDILLAAFAKLTKDVHNVKLQIAGRGSIKIVQRIEKMIFNLQLNENVQLLLNIDEQTKSELLSKCLFFCMPSRYEGWGIAAVEAAACSKAIIATNIPGLREAVKNNYNAVLIKPNSIEELYAAMKALIIDEDKRKKLETNSRLWADKFNWENTSRDEISFYGEVLSNKKHTEHT